MALNAGERARVSERLTALGTPPLRSDGNFVFIEMGDARRAGAIVDALLARGIIIRPTRAFGAPSGVRVTIGLPAENDRFLSEYAIALPELPAPS